MGGAGIGTRIADPAGGPLAEFDFISGPDAPGPLTGHRPLVTAMDLIWTKSLDPGNNGLCAGALENADRLSKSQDESKRQVLNRSQPFLRLGCPGDHFQIFDVLTNRTT